MTKPFIRIHNAETNEIFDREMTDEEFNLWQIENELSQNVAKEKIEAAAKKAAAEAKLAALGLTADDLKALGLGGN